MQVCGTRRPPFGFRFGRFLALFNRKGVAMKRFSVLLVITLAMILLADLTTVYGQGNVIDSKNFSGELLKVDTAARNISVKDADGKEMTFSYNSDTKIIGPDNTPQGLTGKAGTRVLITYHEEKGVILATQIELSQ
jgi:YD repeat-containing protein